MKIHSLLKRSCFLLSALLVLIGIWWFFSFLLHQSILPTPLAVFHHFFEMKDAHLGLHAYNSLIRLFWGLLFACLIGFPIGLLMGHSKWWDKLLDPIIYLTYPIPKIALLPILMLVFGLGNGSKIILITLIVVFQVILSVRDSVRSIPTSYYNSLNVMGANRGRLFVEITFPAVLASILSGIRIALGTAIAILFFTEVYGTEYGLGYFIMDAWSRLNYLDMYCGILLLSFIAFLLFLIIDCFEAHLLKWRQFS